MQTSDNSFVPNFSYCTYIIMNVWSTLKMILENKKKIFELKSRGYRDGIKEKK